MGKCWGNGRIRQAMPSFDVQTTHNDFPLFQADCMVFAILF